MAEYRTIRCLRTRFLRRGVEDRLPLVERRLEPFEDRRDLREFLRELLVAVGFTQRTSRSNVHR